MAGMSTTKSSRHGGRHISGTRGISPRHRSGFPEPADPVSVLAKAAIRDVALETAVGHAGGVVRPPADFAKELRHSKVAPPQTRTRRLGQPIDKLLAGKKNPAAK